MNRKSFLIGLVCLATACGQAPQKNLPVYLDDAQPLEARVEDALSRIA